MVRAWRWRQRLFRVGAALDFRAAMRVADGTCGSLQTRTRIVSIRGTDWWPRRVGGWDPDDKAAEDQ